MNDLVKQINALSEEFYALSQELAGISERKATEWLVIRKRCKTNAEADKEWDATADGRREVYLKIYLKGLEKLRGAKMLTHRADTGIL